MSPEVVGGVAGALGTLAFLPQALKIRRTNNTDGLSQATSLCFLTALVLWTTYGALTGSASLVVTNCFQIAVQLYIVRRVRANARGAAVAPAEPLAPLAFRVQQ